MSKHTIVVEFDDDKEPSYSAGMTFQGGTIVSVMFDDALERLEKLEDTIESIRSIAAMVPVSDSDINTDPVVPAAIGESCD